MVENTTANCGWTKFSETKLIELEKNILQAVKSAYKTWFVPIGSTVGTDDKIWTILVNEEAKKTPLVLLHGFAAGLGFWCLNFDTVAKERPVYAIDLLGFGRSSRPKFSSDSHEAEQQMVDSLEAWRKQLNLENFILLGHSFGGFLATSYAINYPDRVKHLILADPWGFSEEPPKLETSLWHKPLRLLLYPLLVHLNPLATVRAAGPMGPWLVKKMRTDISEKYASALEDKDTIAEYIYQCNSQTPSGETGFHNMRRVIWAKNPMQHRFHKIRDDIPITCIFGEQSWVPKEPGHVLKDQRPKSYVNIEIIPEAGHHVHADQPIIFNEVVVSVCQLSDLYSQTDDPQEIHKEEDESEDNEINDKENDETVHQIQLIRTHEFKVHPLINNTM